ncbi:MAG: DUF1614 domain-containing protein [Candidatus Bathyarchaeota archaeon]|nr:DUF1614 domain-containing protein [Candidatus Bathyarchaeota archaeon]
MSRKTIYFHHSFLLFAVLLSILLFIIGLLFVGVIGIAFAKIGLSASTTSMILIGTFLGSFINIPLLKIKTTIPIIKEKFINFFGMLYRVPQVEYDEVRTIVAVNLGGALIPTAVSIYLLSQSSLQVIAKSMVGVVMVALITRAVARPVKGVGIITPAFIPPLAAAFIALVISPRSAQIVAYVAGVIGTLVGADLANLKVIPKLGAPVVSIGGAGTFDGVFLSGIIAVLLTA